MCRWTIWPPPGGGVTLAGLGHRRIGFVGADNDFMSTIARRQGYLDGLRVLNIPPREDDQTFAGRDYSFASGVEAARRLLARPERPTALFCISDVLALGAVQAAGSWASGCRRTCRWWGLTMWSTP